MTDFTIERLEALKEGTTPGPWGHTSLGYEAEKYPVYGCVPGDEVALVRRQDWELVSAAPALVDALIAEKRENQRIRKELEKAREIYRDDTFPEAPYRGSKGVVVRITRILEGES